MVAQDLASLNTLMSRSTRRMVRPSKAASSNTADTIISTMLNSTITKSKAFHLFLKYSLPMAMILRSASTQKKAVNI